MGHAATEHGDLFEQDDYDHEATSAQLLGRDMTHLLDEDAMEKMLEILMPEIDANGSLLLAKQTGLELEHGRRLVSALREGLADGFGGART